MVKTSLKVSTLVLCPSEKIRKTTKQNNKQHLDKLYMINAMNKAIREKRYLDTVKNLVEAGKTGLKIGIEEYNDIFKQMIERCQCYFTSKYGKNEDDYRRFVGDFTKTFETAIETEHYMKDRMGYCKTEIMSSQREESEINPRKKTKPSMFSRFKRLSTKFRSKQVPVPVETTLQSSTLQHTTSSAHQLESKDN